MTIGLINSLSPLGYSTEMLEALMEYARWRQPVVIAALVMAGFTGRSRWPACWPCRMPSSWPASL